MAAGFALRVFALVAIVAAVDYTVGVKYTSADSITASVSAGPTALDTSVSGTTATVAGVAYPLAYTARTNTTDPSDPTMGLVNETYGNGVTRAYDWQNRPFFAYSVGGVVCGLTTSGSMLPVACADTTFNAPPLDATTNTSTVTFTLASNLTETQAIQIALIRAYELSKARAVVAKIADDNDARLARGRVGVGFLYFFVALGMSVVSVIAAIWTRWLITWPCCARNKQPRLTFFMYVVVFNIIMHGISWAGGWVVILVIFGVYLLAVPGIYLHYHSRWETTHQSDPRQAKYKDKAAKDVEADDSDSDASSKGSKGSKKKGISISIKVSGSDSASEQEESSGSGKSVKIDIDLRQSSSSAKPRRTRKPRPDDECCQSCDRTCYNDNDPDGLPEKQEGKNWQEPQPDRWCWNNCWRMERWGRRPQVFAPRQLCALTCMSVGVLLGLIFCLIVFFGFVMDDYTLFDRMEQVAVVEFQPKTLSKTLQVLYAFPKVISIWRFDAILQTNTAVCGVAYNRQLTDDEKQTAIQANFIDEYGIDMSYYQRTKAVEYATVNDWFSRRITAWARPIAFLNRPEVVTSVADCRLTVFADVPKDQEVWLKNQPYTAEVMLGEYGKENGKDFDGGSLAIFRLAPADYHRTHIPVKGRVIHSEKVDNTIYSVGADAMRSENGAIYNTRVVTIIEVMEGPKNGSTIAFVAIGATCTGSVLMEEGTDFDRGQNFSWFEFGGSTVAVLFPPGFITFDADIVAATKMGVETYVQEGTQIGVQQS